MQLLIDDADFGQPGKLRWIASWLSNAADSQEFTQTDNLASHTHQQPTINGPSEPVVLTPEPELDPVKVFGAYAPLAPAAPASSVSSVAAANTQIPVAHTLTTVAVTSDSPASSVPVPPVGTMTPPNALPVTTTEAGTPPAEDADGYPWDARIHSESKALNKDKTWRFRRNLDPAVRDAVMTELKAQRNLPLAPNAGTATIPAPSSAAPIGVPVPPAAPPLDLTGPGKFGAVSMGVGQVPLPPAGASVVPIALGVPTPPVVPTAPVPLPIPSVGATTTVPLPPAVPMGVPNAPQSAILPAKDFRSLMLKVNAAMANKQLTMPQVDQACMACNVPDITALALQPGLVEAVDAQINLILGAPAAA